MTAAQLEWLADQLFMVRVSAIMAATASVVGAGLLCWCLIRLANVLERLADRFDEPKVDEGCS